MIIDEITQQTLASESSIALNKAYKGFILLIVAVIIALVGGLKNVADDGGLSIIEVLSIVVCLVISITSLFFSVNAIRDGLVNKHRFKNHQLNNSIMLGMFNIVGIIGLFIFLLL